MSSLRDRLAERAKQAKEKAEQEAEAQRKKEDAKQKAEAEKERKRQADPKYQAKHLKQLQKEKIKIEKRLVNIDKALTQIFNDLNNNDDAIIKAIEKDNGILTLNVGGYNNIKQYFNKAGGLLTQDLGDISLEMLNRNEAYKAYKARLEEEGLSIDYLATKENGDSFFGKLLGGTLCANGALGLVVIPPVGALSIGLGMHLLSGSNSASSKLYLHVKEKDLEEQKTTPENDQDQKLLDDLNQEIITNPKKENMVKHNIIK